MTATIRLQRKRTRGWRMPEGAVYVGRGSRWGNPFVVGQPSGCGFEDGGDPTPLIPALTLEQSIEFYRRMIEGCLSPEMHPHGHRWRRAFRARFNQHPAEAAWSLRGRSLACWCALPPPGEPDLCHASVLLELANRPVCEDATTKGTPG